MQYNSNAIQQSLVTRGRREIETLLRELMEIDGEAIKAGHGSGSSRWEMMRREALRRKFHSICDEVAIQLAEILGSLAPAQADVLEAALVEIEAQALHTFGSRPRYGNHADYIGELKADLAKIRAEVVNDIRLGIAGGKNVKKHFVNVNVDNRNATAPQTAVGENINQQFGNVTIGSDPADLLRLVGLLREQLAPVGMPPEKAEEVEDALVTVEREANEPTPNTGRIKRALGVVKTVAESVGAKLAVEAIVKAIS